LSKVWTTPSVEDCERTQKGGCVDAILRNGKRKWKGDIRTQERVAPRGNISTVAKNMR